MALRFFHRIRIAPGFTLNLTKRGASVSVGRRGAHLTIGTSGVRETVGLPGTGIFYTAVQARKAHPGSASNSDTPSIGASGPAASTGSKAQPHHYLALAIGLLLVWSLIHALIAG
jgi:hypothetical protein